MGGGRGGSWLHRTAIPVVLSCTCMRHPAENGPVVCSRDDNKRSPTTDITRTPVRQNGCCLSTVGKDDNEQCSQLEHPDPMGTEATTLTSSALCTHLPNSLAHFVKGRARTIARRLPVPIAIFWCFPGFEREQTRPPLCGVLSKAVSGSQSITEPCWALLLACPPGEHATVSVTLMCN